VLKRVNDNAYRLELREEYDVHGTFNVANLIPFAGGTDDHMVQVVQVVQILLKREGMMRCL